MLYKNIMEEKPIAYDAWEELAEAYSAKVEKKAHNALYERPATLSLLPQVKGKKSWMQAAVREFTARRL
jgi:hypothetical protein